MIAKLGTTCFRRTLHARPRVLLQSLTVTGIARATSPRRRSLGAYQVRAGAPITHGNPSRNAEHTERYAHPKPHSMCTDIGPVLSCLHRCAAIRGGWSIALLASSSSGIHCRLRGSDSVLERLQRRFEGANVLKAEGAALRGTHRRRHPRARRHRAPPRSRERVM